MNIQNINPFVRLASRIQYSSNGRLRYIRDCRIHYVLEGTAELQVRDHTYRLQPDTLFFCRGGGSYGILSNGQIAILVINFDMTQARCNLLHSITPVLLPDNPDTLLPPTDPQTFDDYNFLNSHVFVQDASAFRSSIHSIIEEFENHRILYRERCSTMLKNLLIDLCRKVMELPRHPDDAVTHVSRYIEDHLNENLTNHMLGELVNYHENHLNRLFLQHTGISLHKYIFTRRLTRAKWLLLNTDMDLTTIAEQTGFSSSSHFSNAFRSAFGDSPSVFRQSFKQ